MANPEINLLGITRGSVTAPAGCGKTQLIADTLAAHSGTKPVLVLTHTNAGVAALRARFTALRVPPNAYRLATIDGWSMRLVSMFPTRSELDATVLNLENPNQDYPAIRQAAIRLLASGALDAALKSSYVHLIVDEYQDCSVPQHSLIWYTSLILPTCVLGDPLQAIFGFKGSPLIGWKTVQEHFADAGTLGVPWRWRNAGTEQFGLWLLAVREALRTGAPVDLTTFPSSVRWQPIDAANPHLARLSAAQTNAPNTAGRVLVVCGATNKAGQQELASQTPGAVTAEAVDMTDLLRFMRAYSPSAPPIGLQQLFALAQSVMTNCGIAELNRRLDTLTRQTARNPPNAVEKAALDFLANATYSAAIELLHAMREKEGVRVFRPAILRAALATFRAVDGTAISPVDAFVRVREESRFTGRTLPRRSVGSTLLFKGLEAEVAVVMDAHELDAKNLYVAMTRGSQLLVVCSPTSTLNPPRVD
ncbi:DNA helicase [Paraburkholderia sabiae]|uniref:UvrD-helicase domain-containing protein n=1 Tax=Paraburkholderia sabiae TaxID=273251 RepID=UPI001CAFEF68|nr:UvrD-helicase domain-containing protein [Paraburkholderia sabiae]CAG9225652.1 DNA helicase [Paraburkholderia sabiae]